MESNSYFSDFIYRMNFEITQELKFLKRALSAVIVFEVH
jgi:hypothetical protein